MIDYMNEDQMEKLYNSPNPLVHFVHNCRLNNIIDQSKFLNNIKVLDAGCGEGHLLNKLEKLDNNLELYGVDLADIALNKAKQRCQLAKLYLANICCFDIGEKFDLIICSEVLEHNKNYYEVLQHLIELLKPQGKLIISVPNELNWTIGRFLLRRRPIKIPDHYHSFTPKSFKNLFNLDHVKTINYPFGGLFLYNFGTIMILQKK